MEKYNCLRAMDLRRNLTEEETCRRMKNSSFTKEDRQILASYVTLVEGLADYLGDEYELVLHSLEDLDCSVIRIINGQYTGRKEGAPITDLALAMLSRIEDEHRKGYISYYSRNRKGEPLKATTITIKGTGGRVIGLLCINYYMEHQQAENPAPSGMAQKNPVMQEIFAKDTQELVRQMVEKAREEAVIDNSVLRVNKNKEIITCLWQAHVFEIKDAVPIVARELQISPNTVYLHLRNARQNSKPQ